ncbi:hypothetical protein GCM10027028_61750 [Streptomyces sundarbansensis]
MRPGGDAREAPGRTAVAAPAVVPVPPAPAPGVIRRGPPEVCAHTSGGPLSTGAGLPPVHDGGRCGRDGCAGGGDEFRPPPESPTADVVTDSGFGWRQS